MIKINVNDSPLYLHEDNISVNRLTRILDFPFQGIAISVNSRIIPRTDWDTVIIKDNDDIVVISAACGG